ncbi:hypothetical protein N7462_007567 [Penicillium macrosclerotiorum]|uniref:uncharacterized protein n=1 Tax=Penicillium macrosclerotiorum TaxID=303699 RepID=UPI0025477114|nr:uncharacterized protein N7462_007567 [Penicillium macrosclerotiorum]KAJ5679323.1 hypothetical protein N7462_007567 [Penicillium macrosclerotiorum]
MPRKSKPRRTHSLGGCATCRRRHVKCDQERPSCLTCQTMGFKCEGFSEEIRWIDDRKDATSKGRAGEKCGQVHKSAIRRHLYTGKSSTCTGPSALEQSRLLMSAALSSGLVSDSIDASLEEIEVRSQTASFPETYIRVGPFSVLNFASSSDKPLEIQQSDSAANPAGLNSPVDDPAFSGCSLTVGDLPPYTDDLLQWSDLFGFNDKLYGITSNQSLGSNGLPAFYPSPPFDELGNNIFTSSAPETEDAGFLTFAEEQRLSYLTIGGLSNSTDALETSGDLLADASFLLKMFQMNIVPRMTVTSLGKRSPWSILNVPAALMTLGDLAILESQEVNHARQANLFSLLSCSAIHLATTPSAASVGTKSMEYWRQAANRYYEQGKSHLLISLKEETEGQTKAKYKDQIMAVYGMIESAIFHGHQQDAKCFMIDAEWLLRLRAIPKRVTSRKVRLLANVYAWLRIMGESTYLFHDDLTSPAWINELDDQIQAYGCRQSGGNIVTSKEHEQPPRLDDFLHLEQSDNDLRIDDPKDQTKDLSDIHLQDSRKSKGTLAKQVYGLPETWLSLVSQTTRLANILKKLQIAQKNDLDIGSKIWRSLQERSDLLESVIHSFVSQSNDSEPLDSPVFTYSQTLKALNAALVILFYRRVRNVHPAILEGQVDCVIEALRALNASCPNMHPYGHGTLWPVFIAGCEALTTDRRESLLGFVESAEVGAGLAPFHMVKDIMGELWQRQDEHLSTRCRGPVPTWMDVVMERQIWPIFC